MNKMRTKSNTVKSLNNLKLLKQGDFSYKIVVTSYHNQNRDLGPIQLVSYGYLIMGNSKTDRGYKAVKNLNQFILNMRALIIALQTMKKRQVTCIEIQDPKLRDLITGKVNPDDIRLTPKERKMLIKVGELLSQFKKGFLIKEVDPSPRVYQELMKILKTIRPHISARLRKKFTRNKVERKSGNPIIIQKGKKHIDYGFTPLSQLDFLPKKAIKIYTDGGKRNKTKIGAYAYSIQIPDRPAINFNKLVQNTTNQRMELKAVLQALRDAHYLHDKPIIIVTDSQYVIKALTNDSWLYTWAKNDLKKPNGEKIKNADLWLSMLKHLKKFSNVFLYKVESHQDNKGNNFVDSLVNQAMDEYQEKKGIKSNN